jgi:hypothetical protein
LEKKAMGKSSNPQAHTDKYTMIVALDPDTGEIKTLEMGDDTVAGLHILQWVWDPNDLQWEKMTQPVINTDEIQIDNDALEALITDQLQHYFMDDFDVSGNPIYVGYQDKGGNYYIQRFNTSTGAVDYTKGASGYSTAWTNRATESYDSFEATF